MKATTRPVVREVHLTLDEHDLWELLYSCAEDWRHLIGVSDEKWTLRVTHVDKSPVPLVPGPGEPLGVVRICLSLLEKPETA
jgi:hypothetical protein